MIEVRKVDHNRGAGAAVESIDVILEYADRFPRECTPEVEMTASISILRENTQRGAPQIATHGPLLPIKSLG